MIIDGKAISEKVKDSCEESGLNTSKSSFGSAPYLRCFQYVDQILITDRPKKNKTKSNEDQQTDKQKDGKILNCHGNDGIKRKLTLLSALDHLSVRTAPGAGALQRNVASPPGNTSKR